MTEQEDYGQFGKDELSIDNFPQIFAETAFNWVTVSHMFYPGEEEVDKTERFLDDNYFMETILEALINFNLVFSFLHTSTVPSGSHYQHKNTLRAIQYARSRVINRIIALRASAFYELEDKKREELKKSFKKEGVEDEDMYEKIDAALKLSNFEPEKDRLYVLAMDLAANIYHDPTD